MGLIHKVSLALLLISVFSLSYSIASAQTESKCKDPAFSQFDFWLGQWNLNWEDAEGVTQSGANTIHKILGSCVIEENFSTADGSYTGKSVSVYNTVKQKWQQTWVDNNGSYLDFTGSFENGEMILARRITSKTGKEITQRMVFFDITENNFKWRWESSGDDGKNWVTNWLIRYSRVN